MAELERAVPGIKPAIWSSSYLVEIVRGLVSCHPKRYRQCGYLTEAKRFLAAVDAEPEGQE